MDVQNFNKDDVKEVVYTWLQLQAASFYEEEYKN